MFSSVVRSSLRSSSRLAGRSAVPNRASAIRGSGFRKYSTDAPKSSSKTLLWAGLGVATVGGIALYIYSSEDTVKGAETTLKSAVQSGKAATNFVPTKGDYQKVRCCPETAIYPTPGWRLCNILTGLLQDRRPSGRCQRRRIRRWFLWPSARSPCVARVWDI